MRYIWQPDGPHRTAPQWFNTGLHWPMAWTVPGQGIHYVDFQTRKLTKSKSALRGTQPHACFHSVVADDLVGDGGIMDLWVREARLFKIRSGRFRTSLKFAGPMSPFWGRQILWL